MSQATIDENTAKEVANIEDLEFLKILIPENVRLIPRELIEEVKGRLFTPDLFYDYQEKQLLYRNPGNLLYVLIDKDKKVHGYLWAEISQLDGSMFINTFSVNKDHWHKGKSLPYIMKHLEKLKNAHKCPRVFWITTNERFFLKHGFKRSKNVLMEYESDVSMTPSLRA